MIQPRYEMIQTRYEMIQNQYEMIQNISITKYFIHNFICLRIRCSFYYFILIYKLYKRAKKEQGERERNIFL
jgi:hypothetical protein